MMFFSVGWTFSLRGAPTLTYEFGVKVSLAVTHKRGLMVGARRFAGNPYDGNTLAAQLEQTTTLLEDIGVKPTTAIVDLGFRSVDADIAPVDLIHRGKHRTLTELQRRWLRRSQAIEPAIGHAKHDHRMDRCWLKGQQGDALRAVLCSAGFNIRWLLRAIIRLGLAAAFLALQFAAWCVGLALPRTQPAARAMARFTSLNTTADAPWPLAAMAVVRCISQDRLFTLDARQVREDVHGKGTLRKLVAAREAGRVASVPWETYACKPITRRDSDQAMATRMATNSQLS